MGNNLSPGSQHKVKRHPNLGYSKAGNSELEGINSNASSRSGRERGKEN